MTAKPRSSMAGKSLVAAAICAGSLTCQAQQDSKSVPVTPSTPTKADRPAGAPPKPTVGHMRLLSDAERVPPVTPGFSQQGLKSGGVLPLLAKAGPWINKKVVYREVDKAYSKAVQTGRGALENTGQRGMLLEITVLEEVTPGAQTFYSIYGEGVRMVGVGPDAPTVALNFYRHGVVKLPVGKAAQMTSDSQFVWLEPTSRGHDVSIYPLELAIWVRQISAEQVAQVDRTGQAKAMDDYLQAMRKKAKTEDARRTVDDLIRSRTTARFERAQAEKDFAIEMRRQDRIAQAQAGLKAMAMALSLSSAIAAANATTGADVVQVAAAGGGKIQSYDDLANVLKNLSNSSNVKSIQLVGRSKTLTTELGTIETNAWRMGIELGLKPSDAPVLQTDPRD